MPNLAMPLSLSNELAYAPGLVAEQLLTYRRALSGDAIRPRRDLPLFTLELALYANLLATPTGYRLGLADIHAFFSNATATVNWLYLLMNDGVKAAQILDGPLVDPVALRRATQTGLAPTGTNGWSSAYLASLLLKAHSVNGREGTTTEAVSLMFDVADAAGRESVSLLSGSASPTSLWGHWVPTAMAQGAVADIIVSTTEVLLRRFTALMHDQSARQPIAVTSGTGNAALGEYANNIKNTCAAILDVFIVATQAVARSRYRLLTLEWAQAGLPLLRKAELHKQIADLASVIPDPSAGPAFGWASAGFVDRRLLAEWLDANPSLSGGLKRAIELPTSRVATDASFPNDLSMVLLPSPANFTAWRDELEFSTRVARDLVAMRNRMFSVDADEGITAPSGLSLSDRVDLSPRTTVVVGVPSHLDGIPTGPFPAYVPGFLEDSPFFETTAGDGAFVALTAPIVESRLAAYPRAPIHLRSPGAKSRTGLPRLVPCFDAPFASGSRHPATFAGYAAAAGISEPELHRLISSNLAGPSDSSMRDLAESLSLVGVLVAFDGQVMIKTTGGQAIEAPPTVVFPYSRAWYHTPHPSVLVPALDGSDEGGAWRNIAVRLTVDTDPVQLFLMPFGALPSSARVERLSTRESISRLSLDVGRPDLPDFVWAEPGEAPRSVEMDIPIVGWTLDLHGTRDIITVPTSAPDAAKFGVILPVNYASTPQVRGFNAVYMPDRSPGNVADFMGADLPPEVML